MTRCRGFKLVAVFFTLAMQYTSCLDYPEGLCTEAARWMGLILPHSGRNKPTYPSTCIGATSLRT